MRKTMIAAALAACLLGGSVWAEGYVPPEVPGVWQEISKSDMDTLFSTPRGAPTTRLRIRPWCGCARTRKI